MHGLEQVCVQLLCLFVCRASRFLYLSIFNLVCLSILASLFSILFDQFVHIQSTCFTKEYITFKTYTEISANVRTTIYERDSHMPLLPSSLVRRILLLRRIFHLFIQQIDFVIKISGDSGTFKLQGRRHQSVLDGERCWTQIDSFHLTQVNKKVKYVNR